MLQLQLGEGFTVHEGVHALETVTVMFERAKRIGAITLRTEDDNGDYIDLSSDELTLVQPVLPYKVARRVSLSLGLPGNSTFKVKLTEPATLGIGRDDTYRDSLSIETKINPEDDSMCTTKASFTDAEGGARDMGDLSLIGLAVGRALKIVDHRLKQAEVESDEAFNKRVGSFIGNFNVPVSLYSAKY